jgi:hypothetical protein
MSGSVWPDGGGLLDQPNMLIEAFNVIAIAKSNVKKQDDDGA